MADGSQITEIAKVLATLAGGGLAGSMLTQWRSSRPTKHLRVETRTVNYALPEDKSRSFGNLKVYYEGEAYDQLAYHEIIAKNIGSDSVSENPFILSFPQEAKLLKIEVVKEPENEPAPIDREGLKSNEYRVWGGRLLTGDVLIIRIVVAGSTDFKYRYRGDATCEVADKKVKVPYTIIIMLLALTLLLGIATGIIYSLFQKELLPFVLMTFLLFPVMMGMFWVVATLIRLRIKLRT
jgi:hypothetical protein